MLEKALQGARLLYAYTLLIDAPLEDVFRLTGEPENWARDFEGKPQPNLKLVWEGRAYKPGSKMTLTPLRKDGTAASVGAVQMEMLLYEKNAEISFKFLTGNHLIYRFVYEEVLPSRTEFTVNALVAGDSPTMNTLRQRLYAGRRRKAAIKDHMRLKTELEARARARSRKD
jgi:hypothetical protein